MWTLRTKFIITEMQAVFNKEPKNLGGWFTNLDRYANSCEKNKNKIKQMTKILLVSLRS